MKFIKYLIIITILILQNGCMLMDSFASKVGYEKKEKVELKIDAIKKEKESALIEQEKTIRKADLALLNQTKDNFQQTTNWLYGAFIGSELVQDRNRLDDLITYRLKTALGYSPGPTPEAVLEQNKLLKEELNEKKISNEELQKRYADKEKEAQQAREAEGKRAAEVKAAEEKKQEIERALNSKLAVEQDKLNKINGDLLVLKDKQIANAEDEAQLKKILIFAFFGGAALCSVGAYLMRSIELAAGAVFFAAAAIAVPFIKPWMVLTPIALVIVTIGFVVYKKLNTEKQIADNAIGTIQEVRHESEELYKQKIKPKLQDWFKDKTHLHKKVEQKLVELNQK